VCCSPRRIAVVSANASAAPRAGAHPVAASETRVKLLVAANCLRVPTGRMLLLRLLPHNVRQCGACPGAAGVGVTVVAYLRFKAMLRYHSNLCRGRRPRRPLLGLPQMFASNHCALRRRCVGCPRLLRALRVGTRGVLPDATAQGAVRVGFAKFWLPPACTYLWHIGRKPVNRQFCSGADVRTPTLAALQPA
jgi:hypothetical protein